MFNQLFGAFLVRKDVITSEKLADLLKKASSARVKLGTIAVADGLLTEEETNVINHLQAQYDKRFGDIAVEKGYLTEEQVESLLAKQGDSFMKFLQLLFEEDCLTPSELDWKLREFQDEMGFTDEDLAALKAEDIEQIVNLFAFASKPYVTEIVGLVLRNITRFVTDDYYIGRIERVDELVSGNVVMQRTFGDHSIYLGLAADENTEGFLGMAADYAKEKFDEINNLTYDALCEFINTTSGLFVTNISHNGVTLDMEPPVAYANQIIEGKAYVIPLYVHESRVNIYIAVDSDLTFARKPLELNIEKCKGSENADLARANVIIVDDSALARKVLRQLLEEEGYAVVSEAVNGEEGVELYKKFKSDFITLDITMPKMDGVDALKKIMEFDPNAKAVMITAAGQEKRVIEAIRIGAKHFVVKPFNKDEVLKAIEKCFE